MGLCSGHLLFVNSMWSFTYRDLYANAATMGIDSAGYVSRVWSFSNDHMVCIKCKSIMGKIGQERPVGKGRGYKLSDEQRHQIYELYFNGPYGMRGIAYNLGISLSAVRRNIQQMREEMN